MKHSKSREERILPTPQTSSIHTAALKADTAALKLQGHEVSIGPSFLMVALLVASP